jgi:hypothetical protein
MSCFDVSQKNFSQKQAYLACQYVIRKKTFHFPVLFFEICLTYDGLVSKALPLRSSSPGRFFLVVIQFLYLLIEH